MTMKYDEPKIIVSLTSYPKRIDTVYLTVQSLFVQTVTPCKIILWLAQEQFPDKLRQLPEQLTVLLNDIFEIKWCEDLKPHKKYFYTLLQYPKDCIITVDDDCIYPKNLIEILSQSYCRFPQAVSAMRARVISWDEQGELRNYTDWHHADELAINIPAMDLLPIGCGGVLYPPNIFCDELFNKEYIIKNCLFTDDLWLKIMHAIHMIPVVLAAKYRINDTIDGTQEDALWNFNSTDNYNIMLQLLQDYNSFRADGKLLKDILIGKYGTSITREVGHLLNREKERIFHLLYNNSKLIVYGAGFYAKKTYEAIRNINGLEILCFAVSDPLGNPKQLEGKAVIGLEELKHYVKDCLVIIATDAKHHNQIITMIENAGFHQYLLITETVLSLLQ